MNSISTYNNLFPLRYVLNNILTYTVDNNEIIWKLLKYQEPDALNKDNLTKEEKTSLIYNGYTWDGTKYVVDNYDDKNVFRQPWIDDADTRGNTMLRVYLSNLIPETKDITVAIYIVEFLVHNKNATIISNLGDNDNEKVLGYESRLDLLVQQAIQTLNGAEIGGIGRMFFDMQGNYMTKGMIGLYNNRNYYGFRLALGCKINGTN